MCGLSGIVSPSPIKLADIYLMNDLQAHRGPDGSGVAVVDGAAVALTYGDERGQPIGRVALGHRRLAILDLSEAGAQPMCTADRQVIIVFNGEVFNYRELRAELSAQGAMFRGSSDTEVILAAYMRWGTACFAKFNGMWALAILDRRRDALVLSRDRFGIKPLHYAVDGERLIFASEIKPLLAVRAARPRLVRERALAFLRDGLTNDGATTFVDGIESFPAAHFAEISLARPTRISCTRYWAPPVDAMLGTTRLDRGEATERFKSLLSSAVELRMRSDVPVGTCLSGGLDSSSIVCLASPMRPAGDPMDTFTAGFDDPHLDERRYADAVAAAVGARQNVVVPGEDSLEQDWPALVRAQEEPFTSLSMFAQWSIMRLARERGVKVLLDGQGGDEVMAGYRKYVVVHLLRMLRAGKFGSATAFLAMLARRGDRGLLRIAEGRRYLPRALKSRTPGLADTVRDDWLAQWRQGTALGLTGTSVERRQIDDLERFSVPALLRYEDRNSMAFGIEARVPFLDYRLVEFMLQLAPDLKFSQGRTKALLRDALRGVVPDLVLDRRDKLGFAPPQAAWLRGRFGQHMRCRFQSAEFRLGHLLDPVRLEALLDVKGTFAGACSGDAFRAYALDCWASEFGVEC